MLDNSCLAVHQGENIVMEDYQKIYALQQQHMNDDVYKKERMSIHESWFHEDTVDSWRHRRMYNTIEPLASFYKDKKWLSIGDGRYGLDAYRLRKLFGIDVFPTDISEGMLRKAREMGIITGYGVENAEQLSFPDKSYDLVFCKETFHHCPRPIIALYEMIRVSKDAVVLIEPNEKYTLVSPRSACRQLVRLILNVLFPSNSLFKKRYNFFSDIYSNVEPSGNYVYCISRREIQKVAYGLNLKGVAWKGFNDHYVEGCEFEKQDPKSEIFIRIQHEIKTRDRKCKSLPLFNDWAMITVILFKREVNADLRAAMEAFGYEFSKPFINQHVT